MQPHRGHKNGQKVTKLDPATASYLGFAGERPIKDSADMLDGLGGPTGALKDCDSSRLVQELEIQ